MKVTSEKNLTLLRKRNKREHLKRNNKSVAHRATKAINTETKEILQEYEKNRHRQATINNTESQHGHKLTRMCTCS